MIEIKLKGCGAIMNRDFTLSKYQQLIESIIDTDYKTTTVYDYLLSEQKKCVILRHDVDREIERAMEMAQLEYEYDITSTYYFRHTKDVFKPKIIEKIADMGHEIGFHYEVMDKAKGDPEKAIDIFKNELEDMREISNVATICMHGNPLASWSNRDLWGKYNFKDFGIIGEPYLSINYNEVFYLTDTGRTWANMNIRVKDVVDTSYKGKNHLSVGKISSTEDVSNLILSEKIPKICVLVHPNRWCNDTYGWTKEFILQNLKNVGKAGIVLYRSKSNK
ncbi:hypothetical protein V7O66_01460 [Methanolobus sp. ZRKC3]|uniref:hypothetical protein n=1 Tax=Methanolobus sp. ZRKC3 TaxID=3125786 RepID=UPI00324909E8